MTGKDWESLFAGGPVLLDGATGSNLLRKGMPAGVCPELWILEHPQAILELQRAYVEAGSRVLYAPTFTANVVKLREYGLDGRLEEFNRAMVRLTREAAGGRAYVAGDLTMTGRQLYPVGDLMFEELVDIYKEQVNAILKEGVDLFVVETMMSLQECRAALLAVKENCDLPVMVSLTYNEDGRTLYGTTPEISITVLQAMGADAVGLNCSTGPEAMLPLVQEMARTACVPILAKPNAGMPQLLEGETVYAMEPEAFADAVQKLVDAGASLVGGCCGTTPQHIAALARRLADVRVERPGTRLHPMVASERQSVSLDGKSGFLVVGERINPTGKKALQEELRKGSLDLVRRMAVEQEAAGAAVLDVNMGCSGIDERQMMVEAVYEIASAVDCPLCIDTGDPDVMEAALRIYPGRALINSVSCEGEKLERMLPLAKKYGAMFVLLPLSAAGLPESLEEKHNNIRTVLSAAETLGVPRESAVVDVLVTTVGANPRAAVECLQTITYCKEELQLPTICGLSNISFGMPQRMFVNAAFLNLALGRGLSMAIANPSQELLMYTALAADMLLDASGASDRYLQYVSDVPLTLTAADGGTKREGDMAGHTAAAGGGASAGQTDGGSAGQQSEAVDDEVYNCVVKGENSRIVAGIEECLRRGETPSQIIEQRLIPGINRVGALYEQKKYFLPQLIAGANAMKAGMEYLEPMIPAEDDGGRRTTVVMATVEGDIHDIGKNLVVLMLKNYGFRVIDLGKDVPADRIVERAKQENADVIGLSALMTTTMTRMKEVVAAAKEQGCRAKVIVGGAAITPEFAEEIGADGYSSDAADCVALVKRLTEICEK